MNERDSPEILTKENLRKDGVNEATGNIDCNKDKTPRSVFPVIHCFHVDIAFIGILDTIHWNP